MIRNMLRICFSYEKILLLLFLALPFLFYLKYPTDIISNKANEYQYYSNYSVAAVLEKDYSIKKFNKNQSYPLVEKIKVKFIDGKFKDQIFSVENYIWQQNEYNLLFSIGDKILVEYSENDNQVSLPIVYENYRKNKLVLLIFISISLILFLLKKNGIKLLLSLTITIFTIFFLVIPYIRSGYPVSLTAFFSAAYLIIAILFLTTGRTFKTLVSIAVTITITLIILALGYLSVEMIGVKELIIPDIREILMYSKVSEKSIISVFICGLLYSIIGAVMDVSCGMTAFFNEFTGGHKNNHNNKKLIRASLNVGKDIVFTELGTVFFAYAGIYFIPFFSFYILKTPALMFLHYQFIILLLLYPLLIFLGVLLAIPISIVFWIFFCFLHKKQKLVFYAIIIIIPIFSILFTVDTKLTAWDELPIDELKYHPLIETKINSVAVNLARVRSIKDNNDMNILSTAANFQTSYMVKCKRLFSSEIIIAKKLDWGSRKIDTPIKINDIVLIEKNKDGAIFILDKFNLEIILYLISANILLAFLFIGKRIIYVLLMFVLNFTAIYYCIFPLTKAGYNPIFLSLISIIIIFFTILLFIYGSHKIRKNEFRIAFVSMIESMVLLSLIGVFLIYFLEITGMGNEEIRELKFFSDQFNNAGFKDIQGLLVAITLIACSGVLLDIIINLTSSARELISANKQIEYRDLKKSLRIIGNDISFTMSNSLIFMFIGSYIFDYLLLTSLVNPRYPLLNDENLNFNIISIILAIAISIICVKIFLFNLKGYYKKIKSGA